MSAILATSLNGLNASRARALASANNLANLHTPGYAPIRVEGEAGTVAQTGQGDTVSISQEAVNLLKEEKITKANAAVIRTADEMSKTTIDIIG